MFSDLLIFSSLNTRISFCFPVTLPCSPPLESLMLFHFCDSPPKNPLKTIKLQRSQNPCIAVSPKITNMMYPMPTTF